MGISAQIKWYGDRVQSAVLGKVGSRLAVVGEFLVGEAKQRAPVDTGNLRNSIDYAVDTDNLGVAYGTPVRYGVYQEVGFITSTGRFVQNPYLLPALLENREAVVRLLGS